MNSRIECTIDVVCWDNVSLNCWKIWLLIMRGCITGVRRRPIRQVTRTLTRPPHHSPSINHLYRTLLHFTLDQPLYNLYQPLYFNSLHIYLLSISNPPSLRKNVYISIYLKIVRYIVCRCFGWLPWSSTPTSTRERRSLLNIELCNNLVLQYHCCFCNIITYTAISYLKGGGVRQRFYKTKGSERV